jgi:hypothetical protein
VLVAVVVVVQMGLLVAFPVQLILEEVVVELVIRVALRHQVQAALA